MKIRTIYILVGLLFSSLGAAFVYKTRFPHAPPLANVVNILMICMSVGLVVASIVRSRRDARGLREAKQRLEAAQAKRVRLIQEHNDANQASP